MKRNGTVEKQFHFCYNGEYSIDEYMERAIEKMSYMPLSKELYERKEKFDLSEISYMKQLVEEMMENNIK